MLGRPLTVLDLLTADYWNVKNASNRIIFRNDGTGELWHQPDQTASIAAGFNWRALDPPCLNENVAKGTIKGKNRASSLTIELTLVKGGRSSLDQGVEQISAENEFHDEAFIRKTFTIRLNPTYFRTGKNQEIPRSLVYSYALVFDRSPYPPPDEWKDRENGVKCSGIRDFVGVKVDSRRDSLCIGIKHHLRCLAQSKMEG
ncbi:hypothetical protein N7450_001821 [Penicillium hetheringtonii]|uniref:Uncharacterized protein n=1 Tax=Penicillium hetheringtonii TaxID=911720 RepID=A0AAD6E4X6_9EURO|nr:hypothetical protein N7450_001821 [Penicillium hetheringtonii]